MPWDERGLRRYYYQAVRVNGKPRRIYWGSGEAGRLHELLSARDRRLRAKRAAETRDRATTVSALRRSTGAMLGWIRQLVRATRLVSGEYMHRGQWRWRAGRRPHSGLDLTRPGVVRVTAPGRESGFQPPSPFVPVIAMTPSPSTSSPMPDDLGRRLLELNGSANRGERSALAESEDLLTAHPEVWQTAAKLVGDTAAGWARVLGDGGAVTEACLRREVSAWKAGLVGPDPPPLVTAAVDAAGAAWLAQRYAERELFAAGEKTRAAALRQLAAAKRQVQDSLKLVIAARATADALLVRADVALDVAGGPRLFNSTA